MDLPSWVQEKSTGGGKWCQEEVERLNGQLVQVRERFASIEQVQALCERIGDKLDDASFEDRRFVLEALETQITVSRDGGIKVQFQLPSAPHAIDVHSVSSSSENEYGTCPTSSYAVRVLLPVARAVEVVETFSVPG